MKTLPSFTLALCVCVAATFGAVQLRGLWAQESKTPATGATKAAGPETAAGDKPATEKVVLRRNEASGAVALISLQDAREKLLTYRSIQAKLTETVAMGDRRFRMSGTYTQGTDLKIRLEYEVQVGNTQGRLLEVCDGRRLWTHQTIGKEQRVTSRDVRQILDAAATPGRSQDELLTAELGLGGISGLLASVQSAVQFEKQWEQDFDGAPFVVIDGVWKDAQRAKFLGPNAKPDQPLPLVVPDQIRVYFQKDAMFPRRFMYLKRTGDGRSLRPMVTIDFTDIRWNEDVAESLFKFTPPDNVERQDVTEGYLKHFGKGKESKTSKLVSPK